MLVLVLKKLLTLILKSLESKYPGLSFIIDKVIALLEGGNSAAAIRAHLDKL